MIKVVKEVEFIGSADDVMQIDMQIDRFAQQVAKRHGVQVSSEIDRVWWNWDPDLSEEDNLEVQRIMARVRNNEFIKAERGRQEQMEQDAADAERQRILQRIRYMLYRAIQAQQERQEQAEQDAADAEGQRILQRIRDMPHKPVQKPVECPEYPEYTECQGFAYSVGPTLDD